MYSVCELETRKTSALRLQPWFPTSDGLTLVPGRKRPQLQLRYAHPRRADARRSCECAFVHRKNRFFAGKRSHCNVRAGGVSPPVECAPHTSSRRRNSSHRRRTCDLQTHGGLTPAALVHVRSCIAKIVFSPANVRSATRAGGVSPPWDVLGMRTRNAEIQRVAVANVVSDQRRANAGRRTQPSAIAIALLTPTAG
jgi:hypothetical protein